MSLAEKINGVAIMTERLKSLDKLLASLIEHRSIYIKEISELQKKVTDDNSKIEEVTQEIYTIKQNWKVITGSNDPIHKTRMMFRRFVIKCNICGEPMHSKKDLKVHKFTKHCY